MEQAAHLLTGLVATAALSVLARASGRVGGCAGLGVSLFLWAVTAASAWLVVLAVLAMAGW
jgi:hypothetical protein